ncbi:hypothetical protein COCMIDRAFT_21718 [Bipolaris oryzae ATCC 44560]|uniref:tRNA(Phe) (4-demethylwyosine(37)-C(7)) aminocarboxypropyltransferase n=1 Tax=Bipolaris oryzae ATCC 44560 TaxID=930090 RepID=W6ZT51_COCMI|nr:uncharacterized protein COCMIDRAFT_21718 [Bipolaris oryzae ATCC 44560]EUC50699.1 hypothetical protein COCMIDRAFT_21718 [Bipolaris oryzae ATCC 44560]
MYTMSHRTENQEQEEVNARVAFIVPKSHVKTVKSALERAGQLDRSSKIVPELCENHTTLAAHTTLKQGDVVSIRESSTTKASSTQGETRLSLFEYDSVKGHNVQLPAGKDALVPVQEESVSQQRMRIPTTIFYLSISSDTNADLTEENNDGFKSAILQNLNLEYLHNDIELAHHAAGASPLKSSAMKSPMHRALKEALSTLQDSVLADMDLSPGVLVSAFPDGYSIYKPMLLLPHNAFGSTEWEIFLSRHAVDSELLAPVWQHVAASVGATHVAINSPIPPKTNINPNMDLGISQNQENILRRPVNLVPIHGDFGPSPTPQTISCPTATDFERALWVTTKQNGIWQVWAPLYTMFSRGNIREKTRILNLAAVTTDLDEASAAVDLYAGIGYFAFSYKKSGEYRQDGIRRVLCWEINPWSVEGLRRGAERNGWLCKIIKGDDLCQLRQTSAEAPNGLAFPALKETDIQKADFWVFQASNEGARSDYAAMSTSSGLVCQLPIRHVNLGLLPASTLSWGIAVDMLDGQRGGWIHVHENIGIREVESRSKEIEGEIDKLVKRRNDKTCNMAARVEHVEWVKMYAPGVVHCVLDVHVQGIL